jgi:WD40 repeat protein
MPLSHNDFLSWASFSPNDQIFVQASGLHDHKAVLVDVPTSKTIAEIPVVSKRGFDLISDFIKYAEMLSFHPDSRILMGGNQERVRFWDSTTGKELASLTQVREPAVFSNNGKFVVTTDKDKKSLSFWELTIQQ